MKDHKEPYFIYHLINIQIFLETLKKQLKPNNKKLQFWVKLNLCKIISSLTKSFYRFLHYSELCKL